MTDEQFARLERMFSQLEQELREGLRQTNARIDETHTKIDEGLRHTNTRIDDVARQVGGLAEAVGVTNERLEAVESSVTRLDRTLEGVAYRTERIEKHLGLNGSAAPRKRRSQKVRPKKLR